jgi:protein gp37
MRFLLLITVSAASLCAQNNATRSEKFSGEFARGQDDPRSALSGSPELSKHLQWEPHIWIGVSVENEKYLDRVDHLRKTGAHVKFLSLEPLLGPLPRMNLRGIDWAIAGGESGPGARPMDEEWVLDIRDQCLRANVAFSFKQWGGVFKKKTGRELEGRIWDQMPELAVIS